ncbi:MAG TPA: ABC transporter permease subunit, partial [Thermoanaerobaculia bacterium]|nr:ABC transporter permease subunit [Thermoanaerobaculia bacterium]
MAVLLAWWAVTEYRLVNPLFVPRLAVFLRTLLKELGTPETYVHLWFTTYRATAGLLASIIVGVPLGLLLGRFRTLYRYLEIPIDFFRSVPSSALFFLFILFFGIGDLAKIAVVFYGCSLIMMLNTIYGVRPTREKQERINMLISCGAKRWQLFYLCIL